MSSEERARFAEMPSGTTGRSEVLRVDELDEIVVHLHSSDFTGTVVIMGSLDGEPHGALYTIAFDEGGSPFVEIDVQIQSVQLEVSSYESGTVPSVALAGRRRA